MPRPIDRVRLRAELLTAGRVLTDPLRAGLTEAHRLGALDILLQRIACAAGEAAVAEEIATMRRARHERVMSGYAERTAALAPLASDAEPKHGTTVARDGEWQAACTCGWRSGAHWRRAVVEALALAHRTETGDAPKRGDVSGTDEDAYFDSLDGAEPELERDRRTSEVAT